ncbi:hypothetical protein [Kitasatospora purpeofusca]|uniref:hypothetical protein n=1 Tax=Kitasatospora purpeofusca TaxID=67352 RepID=UPI00386A1EAC|nr:hypothetical protein OIP63_38765 [Kitasatospora purpeofusca]
MTVAVLNKWTLEELPTFNRLLLSGDLPPRALTKVLTDDVFPLLEADPYIYTEQQARQITCLMGLWGSSCVRHFVQRGLVSAEDTRPLFSALHVRDDSFRGYLRKVVDRSRTGHPDRDSYRSLFHWNPPAVHVTWTGQTWTSPTSFTDGACRTYTAEPAEVEFFLFLKKTGLLEEAANDFLEPLVTEDLASMEVVERLTAAAALINATHRMFAEFLRLPLDRRLTPEYFSNVWRQYTGHWDPGDHPPSAAHDPEFLARDLLTGVNSPHHRTYVRRSYPALGAQDKHRLARIMECTPVPERMLDRAGITAAQLDSASAGELARTAQEHPELAACYLVLAEQTRLASSHLIFAKRFVFDLGRKRLQAGEPATPVQSGAIGNTGLTEAVMEQLRADRRAHALTAFERIPKGVIVGAAKPPVPIDLDDTIRIGPRT